MRTVTELSSLEGRVALVAGGAGHIGRTVCATLGELGARVVCADRQQASVPTADIDLRVDLEDERQTRRAVHETVEAFGGLHVLVHCAAYTGQTDTAGWATSFDQQTADAWDVGQRVNLRSAFVLSQEARQPLTVGSGNIIFVSSIYGLVAPDNRIYAGTGMHSPAAYGASKAGLLQLARHLATEFAPRIRVNSVSPGGVYRGQDAMFVERYEAGTPLARMATEEDLKGAIAYLASDLSSYVTGANLLVDGGRTIW